jgi:molecular chaperone HscA
LATRRSRTTVSIRVGVDFGTTHTIVAVADDGNYPVLSLPFALDGDIVSTDHVPSRIALFQGKAYYGPAADWCFRSHYKSGVVRIPSIKRLLYEWYEGMTLETREGSFEVETLLTGYLAAIRKAILAAMDLKKAHLETVIAVPANASSSQRYVTLSCFRAAGFKVLRILDEPVASGIQFVRERYKRWDRVKSDVMIYDLGGGTFDTTLLAIDNGKYDPVVTRGISRLGGDDFDRILLDLVEKEIGRRFEDDDLLDMLQQVRDAKESMGPYTQKLHLDVGDDVVSVPVKTFLDASTPLLNQTLDLVDRVLEETRGRSEPPDRIVLVGGGSLLPLVPKTLRDRYGRAKIHQGLYPLASVAIGAAMQAENPDLEVVDRLTNHFGVIRVRADGYEYVDVIFEKGRRLPKKGKQSFVERPGYDPRHNIGRFQYLECDDVDPKTGKARGQKVLWNTVLFPYDRNLNPDGAVPEGLSISDIATTHDLRDERITEEYFLDEYGIITSRISRSVQDNFTSCHNLYRRT